MKTFSHPILALYLLLGIAGCNEVADNTGDSEQLKLCHQKGSFTEVFAQISSTTHLPKNLLVRITGSNVQIDECTNDTGPFGSYIQLEGTRHQAQLVFLLDDHPDIMSYYFPEGPGSAPQLGLVDFEIFSRNDCSEEPLLVDTIEAAPLDWSPVYANGISCGVTSHSASLSVDLN